MTDAEGGGTIMWWGISPGSWARHANRLRRSAEFLWEPIQQLLDSGEAYNRGEGPEPDYELWDHSFSFLLLAGCALEAMLKAAAIQKGMNTSGFSAVMTSANTLEGWVGMHNLPALARRAGMEPDQSEQAQLERFEKYVVWAGRYPVPKTLREKHPDGVLYVDFDVSSRDRVRFGELFSVAEALYLKHKAASPGSRDADTA